MRMMIAGKSKIEVNTMVQIFIGNTILKFTAIMLKAYIKNEPTTIFFR